MDFAKAGDDALSASNYSEAIQAYTKALAANPSAAPYYTKRSTAYQRAKQYTEALADAEVAVVLACKRGSRELIKDAQFRRALSLFFLEQYADAKFILDYVTELDPKNKMTPIWEGKIATKLKDLPEGDVKAQVTVKKVPDVQVPSASAPASKPAVKSTQAAKPSKPEPAAAPKPVVPTPANKIKHDWYQSADTVTVNILAKGAPKESTTVEFEKDTLSVSFPVQGSDADYNFTADPLYASIDPSNCKFRVTPNRIEITLTKATPSKWHALEGDRVPSPSASPSTTEIPSHILTHESAPVYPTSSKTGAKNWDKLAIEAIGDKDEMEGDETSHFFKKLYKDASAEQQRAMMKSYQESGGTVLSTDWSNVGGKTVVPEPPDGMEAKKY